MAVFHFKLHAVLRQRELAEQGCQRDLAVAQAARAVVQAELARLEEAMRAALADLRQNQLVGSLNLSFLAAHRRFILAMQRQTAVQLQKMQEAQSKVVAEQARLAEAAKQRKVIEKLRERQHAEWAEAIARKESAAMDEIAGQMTVESMREQWASRQTADQPESSP
jgi:flagellar FliJ protein